MDTKIAESRLEFGYVPHNHMDSEKCTNKINLFCVIAVFYGFIVIHSVGQY